MERSEAALLYAENRDGGEHEVCQGLVRSRVVAFGPAVISGDLAGSPEEFVTASIQTARSLGRSVGESRFARE